MNEENENVVIDEEQIDDNIQDDSTQEETEEELNDQSFEDGETDENPNEDNVESTDKKQPEKPLKKELSKEERAKFARLRREAEQKEKIEKDAFERGLIEAVDGINPFTNEPIKTRADIDEFLNMREASKAGYDPVSEYSKFLKEKQNKQAASSQTSSFDYDSDRKEFLKSFPDIDLENLVADEDFNDFAEGLVGNVPLKDIYSKYQKFQAKIEQLTQQRVLKEMSKGKSSAGSLENKQEKKSKSFEEMTDEEFEKQIALAKSGGLAIN